MRKYAPPVVIAIHGISNLVCLTLVAEKAAVEQMLRMMVDSRRIPINSSVIFIIMYSSNVTVQRTAHLVRRTLEPIVGLFHFLAGQNVFNSVPPSGSPRV